MRNDLRDLAKMIAGAALVAVALNLAADHVLAPILSRSTMRLSQAAHGGVDVDVVVVGDSRGVSLLEGDGKRTFNLAYTSIAREQIFGLVKDFFASGNRARVVVVEASGVFQKGEHCEVKPYWSLLPHLADASRDCRYDALLARLLPLTAYNGEIFLHGGMRLFDPPAIDQHWAFEGSLTGEACAHPPAGKASRLTIDPADIASLQRDSAALRDWLRIHGNGAEVVFVLAPYLPAPEVADLVNAVRAASDKAFGSKGYVDLSRALPRDCTLFADPLHMNVAGRNRLRSAVLAAADHAR